MAVDANETRRQRVLDALANLSDRTWTRTVGANTFAFTVANPQLRILNGFRVLSVEVTVTRNGVTIFDDMVNMPNPATKTVASDGTATDAPLQALRAQLFDSVSAVLRQAGGQARLQRNPDGSFQGDTLSVRSGTNDGVVLSDDTTFALMAAGTGATLSANTAQASASAEWDLSGGHYTGRMFFADYDTSTIGASASISAAVYTFYGTGTAESDTDGYNAEVRYKDWGGTVTTADWFDPRSGVWNALVSGGVFDVTSWDQTSGNANNFSDSGVYTSIQKTGTTRIVLGLSGMNASTPTGVNLIQVRTADQAGTTADPLLTVTYSTAVNATITGVTGAATATGIAGTVTAQITATVTGVTGTATADGIAGSVSTGLVANITGVTGDAAADGIAGVVSTVNIVNITGVTAAADAAGVAGSVTAGIQITISGETGAATADGIAGSITAQIQIAVTGVTGAATAAGIAGTVDTVEIVSLTGVTATATATGIAGVVAIAIIGVTATATATGIAGVLTFVYQDASGTISDARAYSATLADAYANSGTLSDARIRGGTLADDYAYGGVLTDARTSGGSISDG